MPAIQHLAFNCRDRLALERFYARHFGFRRARVFNAGSPNEFVMLRLGACCIELFQSPQPDAPRADAPVGYKHLAIEVEDLDAVIDGLRGDGIEPGEVMDSVGVGDMRICFLQDPEGNTVELMQGWVDQDDPPQV